MLDKKRRVIRDAKLLHEENGSVTVRTVTSYRKAWRATGERKRYRSIT